MGVAVQAAEVGLVVEAASEAAEQVVREAVPAAEVQSAVEGGRAVPVAVAVLVEAVALVQVQVWLRLGPAAWFRYKNRK